MNLQHKDLPFKIKEVSAPGEFSGYLSVFGNIDSYGDIVMQGAFEKTLEKLQDQSKTLPVLWQHNSAQPIGVFTTLREDDKGLYVEGKLLIEDVQQAREAHSLMKAGAISGMSIGYIPTKEMNRDDGLVEIHEMELWEGSVVTFPANTLATIDRVKSHLKDGELPSLKEFEKLLREAGFSKSQATAVASHGLTHLLRSESDSKQAEMEAEAEILQALKSFNLG